MLVPVDNIISSANDYAVQCEIRRALADLSDEINATLSGYRVQLVHLEGDDYLEFLEEEERGEEEKE